MRTSDTLFGEFLHGAAVYPEFMPRAEWLRLLDDMASAGMNTARLLESAWGWLEPVPGERRHGEARRWLDDVHERGLRSIVGTGSFLPPQWLFASHPDALVLTRSGERAHPLARKSACLEHPAYREAVRAQVAACARAWGTHPAVIAWQLDNEIDRVNLDWTCHCASCEAAWTRWLEVRFGTVAELNRRLRLDHWGLEIGGFSDLPLPRVITEIGRHPGLAALEARFRRDRVTDFLREQKDALHDAGAAQPASHNYFATPDFTAEDPGAEPFLDFGAYDLYLDWEPVENAAAQLRKVRLMEQLRAGNDGEFLLMETSMGVVGGAAMVAPAASEAAFRRRLMLALAAGARGVLYWTGPVWRGGPWIFHGAMHDFAGSAVPEMPRIARFGAFLQEHGATLLDTPVRRDVAVIGSHAGNALAAGYPVYPGSDEAGRRFEAVCRGRGLAVDVITLRQAADASVLARYRAVALFGESQGLASVPVAESLERYVLSGGTVIVGPLAGYVTDEGTVDKDGLCAGLRALTGLTVPVFRWFGEGVAQVVSDGATAPALHGFVEAVREEPGARFEVAARIAMEDEFWHGQPALVGRALGKGSVWKYLATPDAGADSPLWAGVPPRHELLAQVLPDDVLGVPRDDGSLFLVNLSREPQTLNFTRRVFDRIADGEVGPAVELNPEAALWVA